MSSVSDGDLSYAQLVPLLSRLRVHPAMLTMTSAAAPRASYTLPDMHTLHGTTPEEIREQVRQLWVGAGHDVAQRRASAALLRANAAAGAHQVDECGSSANDAALEGCVQERDPRTAPGARKPDIPQHAEQRARSSSCSAAELGSKGHNSVGAAGVEAETTNAVIDTELAVL